MRGITNNITGQKFNRLTAIEMVGTNKHRHAVWMFKCDCGNITCAEAACVIRGGTKSCGCLNTEVRKSGDNRRKYQCKNETLYKRWLSMKERCQNPNDDSYKKWYGSKGITVCDEWKNDFEAFQEWSLSNGFSEELSLDRIDPDGNYSPENCRWANSIQQANNKHNNRIIIVDDRKFTLTELSKEYPISTCTFYAKRKKSKDAAEAYLRKRINCESLEVVW